MAVVRHFLSTMKKRLNSEKHKHKEDGKAVIRGRPPEYRRIKWDNVMHRLDFSVVPKGSQSLTTQRDPAILNAIPEEDNITQSDGIAIAVDLWKKKTPGLIKLDSRQHDCTTRNTCFQTQLMVSCLFWVLERKCNICVYVRKREAWYPICDHIHPQQNKTVCKWTTNFVYLCSLTGALHVCGPKCNMSVFTGDQYATCPLTGFADANNRKMKAAFHPGANEEFSANHEFGSKRAPPSIDEIIDSWIPSLMEEKTVESINDVVAAELAVIQQNSSITAHIVIAAGEMWKLFCDERYASERLLFKTLLSNAHAEALKVIQNRKTDPSLTSMDVQHAFDGQFVGYAHAEFVSYNYLQNIITSTVLMVIQYWIAIIKQRSSGVSTFGKQVGYRESVIPIIYTMAFGFTAPNGAVVVPGLVFLAQIIPTYRILKMYIHDALVWNPSVCAELRNCFLHEQHDFVDRNKTYHDLPHTIAYVQSKKTLHSLCLQPSKYASIM